MENQETMLNTSKEKPYNIIAGILFALAAIMQLLLLIGYISYAGMAAICNTLLDVVGFAIVAFAVLSKRRDFTLAVGFAVLAIANLIGNINLFSILTFAVWLFAGFMSVVYLTEYLYQYRAHMKKLWCVPGIWMALVFVGAVISSPIAYKLLQLFCAGGALFAMRWIVCSNDTQARPANIHVSNKAENAAQTVNTTVADEVYCGLVKHILLLLFTFGIWYLIWIYRMTRYLNCVEDEETRNPTTKLLLCLFVPFYSIYWIYKSAQRIDKLAAAKGVSSDLSTLCLILAIFVGILPPILMQEKINTIITAENSPIQQPVHTQTPKITLGTADELKTYKELLDSGVITQEEFDAKKKQLLGL